MKLAVIIPAAGASSRYRAAADFSDRSKLDEDLGGRPVLQRTVELFCKRPDVDHIIVAGPHDDYDAFLLRHGDKLGLLGVNVCRGGKAHRYETVKAALELVPDDTTHIAVHDAARPAAPPELLDRLFLAAEKHSAVIPAVDVGDTLKRASADVLRDKDVDPLDAILGGGGKSTADLRTVEATLPRDSLVLVQTPQVFEADLLRRAYAQPDLASTDDASLVERLGEPVVIVEGDPRNIKVTHPKDLDLIRQILGLKGPDTRPVHKRF